jgi:hypothetical protein
LEKGRRLRGQESVGFLNPPAALDSLSHVRTKSVRGQSASEFIVIFCLIMLLFFMFYALYTNQIVISYQANEKIICMRVATAVASAIDYVYLAGDGTVYNTTIRTSGMNVMVSNGIVVASSNFSSYSFPLLTKSMNDTPIYPGSITITNRNGVISIG